MEIVPPRLETQYGGDFPLSDGSDGFSQGFGSILYRTTLPELKSPATLTVNDAHDYAQVFVDGKYIGKLDRRNGEKQLVLPACVKGSRLDILVEAMGRINFGRAIKDFKGITKNVELSMEIGRSSCRERV